MWWFWWWLLFVFLFLLIPLSYGWGYRGWGPPSYRRGPRRQPLDPAEEAELREIEREEVVAAEGWGVLGLLMWIVMSMAVLWLVIAAFTI